MASPRTPSKKIRLSPQAQVTSQSHKLEKQTDEIRTSAAEALGYHTAGLHNRLPETLKTLMNQTDGLAMYLKELNNIKPELAAIYNDLNSTKKMLETLKSENTKLKENIKELEKTMFDDFVDEDSEKCVTQT